MKSEHIIHLLEELPLRALSEAHQKFIQEHLQTCADCRRAYTAAQVYSQLLTARLQEGFEPPPFFTTRVMASLREQQKRMDDSLLTRFWKAARALVYSMALAVLLLIALTAGNSYFAWGPAEVSIANRDAADLLLEPSAVVENDLSDTQVIEAIYEPGN